jgi:chaperone BCS1
MENIFFDAKTELLTDVHHFIRDREWYKNRGILYKRGYLFHGPPGNGKTSTILALSRELGRNLHFMTPAKMDDDAVIRAFNNLPANSILVIEDIDMAFKVRQGKRTKHTLSTLFNCLDGAFSKEGIIVIFTTNHKEQLDPALIRHGRIDKWIFFDNPSKKLIDQYLEMFFNDSRLNVKSMIYDLSMSTIQDICLRHKEDPLKACEKIELEASIKTLIT